ncbi:uncharacterized protein RSE6_03076 [Rhynchosporium secalis]|uniref:Uncharacterized protein n=1 Tax=Rhynchosporium secalis TaxID=38038 RepID=A0A1E1M1U8_RHYSE|nr:uncharacterized protein RSE6_03076 [Rhynchosporium secalis]
MAAAMRSRTPEPPSSLQSPGTPRWGYDDNYQPYTPRKSARVQQRSRDAQTPPPATRRTQASSNATTHDLSNLPSSPQTASKKRTPRNSLSTGGRRVSGALTFDSMTSAAASLGLPTPTTTRKTNVKSSSALRNNGFLPTPAKTPNERPTQIAPAVRSIARNLFPARSGSDEEVMPNLKKKGRKYTGFTLDSFEADEASTTPIQIFTDSHDRVPEVDLSPENPFYGESGRSIPEPTKRTSKRRKVTVPGEGEHTVEELEQREDGLVYVFRGKKVFRKFGEDDDHQFFANETDSEDEVDDQTLTTNLRRPLTRSSLKPRLLFPTAEQSGTRETRSHNTEDEEADTDIEEPMNSLSTPLDQIDDITATPKAPRFGPVTPPTTARATRSRKAEVCSSPADPTSDDEPAPSSPILRSHRPSSTKVSPFDQWQRVKPVKASPGKGKKRNGEPLIGAAEKKVRGRM